MRLPCDELRIPCLGIYRQFAENQTTKIAASNNSLMSLDAPGSKTNILNPDESFKLRVLK
jgi:hypothetical protein